ncbi:sensor histidine kinase [Flavobacterium beibuense]|uniref:histidine kinase n=1 Tax=Flavobacterium beibuense TaxID=657326 RepID=A0A444WAW6_9FLAO|nr:ATP-binding protein [Flavobacterium beibuense]RYJ42960.1 putative two component sensor histidine kinase [Flavobacterium beibuense]
MDNKIAFGIIISLLFVSLLVLFCALLIKLYINKVKGYTRLIYQKDLDFQKTLTETVLETQEEVLNNISQDLHDDAGQQLTYINFMLENIKLDSPELEPVIEPVSQQLKRLSGSIRSISHSLNNQLIIKQNLVRAIESEVTRLQKNNRIKISLNTSDKGNKSFDPDNKIVIYRIFQEIVNNIFKHSKATQVNIELITSPKFMMKISDNGVGFDYNVAKNNNVSLGLKNITNRAALINYDVEINSVLNEGTTIKLTET